MKTYIWMILTWNESGFDPWSSATYFSVETTGVPVAPNNLQVTAISATEVRLDWADNSNNETGFVIYDNGLSIATAGTDVTSTSIGNLIFNASHCYQINAYNEYGYSELSNEACINLSSKLGDANGDSKVDGIDYVIWVNHYGQSTPNGPADGDFDYRGFVDDADYQIWLQNYTGSSLKFSSDETIIYQNRQVAFLPVSYFLAIVLILRNCNFSFCQNQHENLCGSWHTRRLRSHY